MLMFKLVLSLVAGYAAGSVNTSIIVGRAFGVDPRKKGSGNAGMTNTVRVHGAGAGALVFLGDTLKGVAACLLGYLLTANELGSDGLYDFANPSMGAMLAGTSCVFGHVFPMFFQFKGGKGALTSAAVVFMIDWRAGAASLAIFIIILLTTRYVSAGSIAAAAGLPAACAFLEMPAYGMVYMAAISLLVIVMHRKNIGRLISGTEPKLMLK